MSKYDPVAQLLRDCDELLLEIGIADLERRTGVAFPPSARRHAAWWASGQPHAVWTRDGWRASPDLRAAVVRFTRKGASREVPEVTGRSSLPLGELILVGCVSQKRDVRSPAKDLCVSSLWARRRSYAEGAGRPWAILSTEYGLVLPEAEVDPYDRSLGSEPESVRREWSLRTAAAVLDLAAEIGARSVEVHAGAAYIDNGLEVLLRRGGLGVVRPLEGMRIGEQLAWYGAPAPVPRHTESTNLVPPPTQSATADHVHRIAHDYLSGSLGEGWGQLPEMRAYDLPDADPTQIRQWLTFVCAMDRARNADALWEAGLRAWHVDPWVFSPSGVCGRSLSDLADTLRRHKVSQRHSGDSFAWRVIAESLVDRSERTAVHRVMAGEPVDATDLLRDLRAVSPRGTARYPLLSGPKIGPLWVRVMAEPGGAPISGIASIPVAVDTHVQRVTEMLGVVPIAELTDSHRSLIETTWFAAVAEAGSFGAPGAIDGTCAGLDPALWVLGKNGCSRCEKQREKLPIGTICDLCPVSRLKLSEHDE